MTIVYLMRFWPVFGGGETVTRTLANEMCSRGHKVHIVYLWERTNGTNVFVDPRICEHKIQSISNVRDGALKRSEFSRIRKALSALWTQIHPDVVIDQWIPTRIVYNSLRDNNQTILIKCHHGSVKHNPVIRTLKQRVFYGVFKEKGEWIRVYPEFSSDYANSDAWVLLSEGSKREAEILLPWADRTRFKVIPNPLPYTVSREKIKLEQKKKEIVFVGRVIRLKRVDYILKAWRIVESRYADWTLKIIGDGDDLESEKGLAAELQLQNVSFEGFQDPRQYLIDASILVMASAQEGFGMALVEAQQCGCIPVVFNSFATVTDIIENRRNGILVKDEDIEGFAKALEELICNPEVRRKLSENAMNDSGRFSVSKICDQWETLIESLPIRRGGDFTMKKRYWMGCLMGRK